MLKCGVSQAKHLFRRHKGVCGLQGDGEEGRLEAALMGGSCGVHVGALPLLRPQSLPVAGLSMRAILGLRGGL